MVGNLLGALYMKYESAAECGYIDCATQVSYLVGTEVGADELGLEVGCPDGRPVGWRLGWLLGCRLGWLEG